MIEKLLENIVKTLNKYLGRRGAKQVAPPEPPAPPQTVMPHLVDGETPFKVIVREVGDELGKYGPLTIRDILAVIEWRFPKSLAAQPNNRWRINAFGAVKWVALGTVRVAPTLNAAGVERIYCHRDLLMAVYDGSVAVPDKFKAMLKPDKLVVPSPEHAHTVFCEWGTESMPPGMLKRLALTRNKLYGINVKVVPDRAGLEFGCRDELVLA